MSEIRTLLYTILFFEVLLLELLCRVVEKSAEVWNFAAAIL